MSVRTFAAVDVGSYELSMKIFEVSRARGMKEIDHVRHSIDMGTETYSTGKLSYERVDELCRVLREFKEIMKSYQVEEYQAYGTSAIREMRNKAILLEQIELRTGIHIEVLSNSEQRFLDYKSIAFQGEGFMQTIEKGTAILDIGGGSIQISLFDNDTLVSTQNMKLGVLRLQDRMQHLEVGIRQFDTLVAEIVESQLSVYRKLYLKDRQIKNIIIVDDYISALIRRKDEKNRFAERSTVEEYTRLCRSKNLPELAKMLDMPEADIPLLSISLILLGCIMDNMEAERIWAPGVTLCDGIAYEYAEKNKMITAAHDFEKDIIACAQNISKRYRGSRKRSETLERIALALFDGMEKNHGLGKRERLLLQISTILHDCGKYVSMANLGECSYSIIMATEIIGLSHQEREIVANVVKYNHLEFEYYETMGKLSTLDKEAYVKLAKLTAILRLANGLDRSHKQKFRDVKIQLREDELLLLVDTDEDITLEKGLFGARADFFEEVYSIRPVIKRKRS